MLFKKSIVIVLVCAVCVSSGFSAEAVKVRKAAKPADPFTNTSVLVEAFVVRVSTKALAEVGVKPIGGSSDGISPLKIAACLTDPKKAGILAGAKVTTTHNHRSLVQNRNTIFIKTETDNSVSYDGFENGTTFSAIALMSHMGLRLEYEFSASFAEEADYGPPRTYSFDWEGVVNLRSGKPVIAGAVQDDESVTFLILTATIQ